MVDDGSTDSTAQVACSFSDARVRYIHQENRGLSAARNTGILRSSGEYLTFLDSDDQFVADKLETLLNAMQRDPGLGFVAGQAVLIDENSLPLGKVFDTPLPENPVHLLLWNPLHVCSVMMRRDWQQKVGLFDESLHAYEDWDMWLRLARAGCRMGWVAHPDKVRKINSASLHTIVWVSIEITGNRMSPAPITGTRRASAVWPWSKSLSIRPTRRMLPAKSSAFNQRAPCIGSMPKKLRPASATE